jgi:hypothetical protein
MREVNGLSIHEIVGRTGHCELDPFKDEIPRPLQADVRFPGTRVRELIGALGYEGARTILGYRRARGQAVLRATAPVQRTCCRRPQRRLRGDRPGRPPRQSPDLVYEASLSRCASGSPSSFFSVLFSIWRIRSRVTPNARPTSSSVRALWPRSP